MSQYGNYKSALFEKMVEESEIHRITCKLIIKSRWAGWLPFGHSLAANYYSRKARRIYNAQQVAKGLNALNRSTQ
jgi:hypothetical protein